MEKTAEQIAEDTLDDCGTDVLDALEGQDAIDRRAIWILMVKAIKADRSQQLDAAREKVVELNADIDHAVKISNKQDIFERGDNRSFLNLTWGSYDSGYRAALYEWLLYPAADAAKS